MKLVAKMLGIVVIGGALSTAACGNKDNAEGAPAVAVENAASTVNAEEAKPEAKADEAQADEAATATADEAKADEAKGGSTYDEADCPFDEEKGEAAGGCAHEHMAKADDHGHAAKAAGDEHMGCGGHEKIVDAAPDESGDTHFGAAFSLPEAKPLAKVVADAGEEGGDVVQVSGTIHQVCQTAGCWMVVKDGDAEARVVMKGHAFTVPKDSKGKPTLVEGTLKVRTFTEAQAKHLAEDAGKDPSTVTGPTKEYVVTASAITIKKG